MYLLDNSILAPYQYPDSVNINTAFQKNVTIGVELASLNCFAEYVRITIWSSIFKASMYVKYYSGKGVSPCFDDTCPYKLDELYKDSDIIGGDGLLSTIATPTIDIFNEKIDLTSISLEATDIVENFSVFSNVLQIQAADGKNVQFNIPGSSKVTLISHVVSAQNNGSNPPTVSLSKPAFTNIKTRFCCGEFYGGLHLTNRSDDKSVVVMDGLVFEMIDGKATVSSDLRAAPPGDVSREHSTDLQFALVAAEARLNFLLTCSSEKGSDIQLLRQYLIWLGRVAGIDSANCALQA